MQKDIEALKGKTVSAVAEGYDALLLAELAGTSKKDILYILSDGVELAKAADVLEIIAPEVKVLRFPAWDTVPYDRVSPHVNIVAQRIETLAE